MAMHPFGLGVTRVLYGSDGPSDVNEFLKGYARAHTKKLRRGFPTLGLSDFRGAKGLALSPGEVFASIVAKDGHVASVVVVGRNGQSEMQDIETIATEGVSFDWHEEIQDHSLSIFDQPLLLNDPGRDISFISLIKKLLEIAFRVEPSVGRILLHCDAMFRQIAWQRMLLQEPLREYTRGLARQAMRKRLRRTPIGDWDKVVVLHVSGVCPRERRDEYALVAGPRNGVAVRGKHELVIDESDKTCIEFGSALKAQIESSGPRSSVLSRLSVVQHARRDRGGIAVLLRGNEKMSGEEMANRFSGYPLVLLHACVASTATGNVLGDLGGLPGFFLSHGVDYLVASPHRVFKSQMLAVENHFAGVSRMEDIPDRYFNAIEFRSDNPLTYELFRAKPVLLD
jgi:hypothetical protein